MGYQFATAAPTEQEARKLAEEAYVFGFPLVIADVTRQVMTAVPDTVQIMKAPVNQFAHCREFPDYTFTDVVSPNADTLYSTAWLDLSKDAMVLSVPEMGERYYLMMMMDAWTNVFASPGTRTTGNGKNDFVIGGPSWRGTPPAGVKEIKSPTNMMWLLGRTQTNGKGDYAAVRAIQDRYKLTLLSDWNKAYNPPVRLAVDPGVDATTPPVEQVARMDGASFFKRLNTLMSDNPPADVDAPALSRFAAIGVSPGKPFDADKLHANVAAVLEESAKAGMAAIVSASRERLGHLVNGWSLLPENTANFGVDYTYRAVVALMGLGANLPADAIYPHAMEDADGQPLSGARRYVIRFPKGQLPPVNAFWSFSMYNAKQAFVQNPIGRYSIGSKDKLRLNPDGSLTIYLQHNSPGEDKESNWLPAPADRFNVFLRLYWPKPAIVDGAWRIPPIERVS